MHMTQPQASNTWTVSQCSDCCLHAHDDIPSCCEYLQASCQDSHMQLCCRCSVADAQKGNALHLSSGRGDLDQCCLGNLFSADCCKSQAITHSSALHQVIFALQDLLADPTPGAPQQKAGPAAIANQPFTNKQVLQAADFRNLHFLNAFVSDGGQILNRNKTKLQAKVHRHLARQIKTARVMALLPHAGAQHVALHSF